MTLTGHRQRTSVPTVVLIDEFAAVDAGQISRLFGRGRSAGLSLLLVTQELADLSVAGAEALREQVLGNLGALIAHRQTVPESAETIAAIAGTRAAWVTTSQIDHGLISHTNTGKGTRKRGYEYWIHPSQIKSLPTGYAAVIAPGSARPTIARLHHPQKAGR